LIHGKRGDELGLGQLSCFIGFRLFDDGHRDRPDALGRKPRKAGGTDLGVDPQERVALLGLVERFTQAVGPQVAANLHCHDHVVRLADAPVEVLDLVELSAHRSSACGDLGPTHNPDVSQHPTAVCIGRHSSTTIEAGET
jgi:hypothetical protein